jgi:hypothetical protein
MDMDTGDHFPQQKPLGCLGQNQGQSSQMDFVLKILTVNGQKVRVQLWDMAGSQGIRQSKNLAPLFIRNAVASIVVARADKQDTIKK